MIQVAPAPERQHTVDTIRASAAREAEVERLGDEIAELAAHIHAATYRLLTRLREFDRLEGWSGGFRSCAHWLSWRTGLNLGAAREKVRVARALEQLPQLSEAMKGGELSYAKARAVTRVADVENEEALLELARNATAADVERVVRAWRRVDRQEEAWAERERHRARHLSLYVDDDGSYVIRGRLDPEVGALLGRALDAASAALYRKSDASEQPSVEPGEEITAVQRKADAIGLVAERALRNVLTPETSSESLKTVGRADRFQVVVHVDAEALRESSETGQAVLEDGARISAETSRRLACDASKVVMVHDAEGKVLDVGRRTRTVPVAIRRALDHRDRGCRFPGCGLKICDAHHVRHWADGGKTRLDNLLLACRRHHRLLHEGGYRVTVTEKGELQFLQPDGRPLLESPGAPRLSSDPVASLQAQHRELGIEVNAWTATPHWLGERLDFDFTMWTLRASEKCSNRPRWN